MNGCVWSGGKFCPLGALEAWVMGHRSSQRATFAALAATALALVASAPASAAPTVRVVTADQAALLKQGKLTVRVRADRGARLRLRFLISSGNRTVRVVPQRTLKFRARQTRTVRLGLTPTGRSFVRRERSVCRRTTLTAYVYRRDRGRRGRLLKSRRGLAAGGGCIAAANKPGAVPAGGDAGSSPGGATPGGARPDGQGSGAGPGVVAPQGPALLAGAASRDITPPIGTPMFAYTARSQIADPDPPNTLQILADPETGLYAKTFEPSKGIHTRVRARAIVLKGDRGKFALVQADLGGLPYALTQEVLKRLPPGTGIDADRVLISATHTHASTGPIWPADNQGYAILGGDIFDPRIFGLTAQGIADAIIDANARLVPARAGVGTTELRDASRNRAFGPFKTNSEIAPLDDAAKQQASIDPTVTVLRVDALGDGRPIGVWSNFALHQTSFGDGNLLFSGDNAGFAERAAEAEITRAAVAAGRPAGDVVNVWTNGAEGDISPNGGPTDDPGPGPGGGGGEVAGNALEYVTSSYAGAHIAGRRIGEGIAGAWRDAGTRLSETLDLDARRRFVSLQPGAQADGSPVGSTIVLGAGVASGGQCALVEDSAGPGQGKKQLLATGELVPRTTPVSVVRAGRLAIAAYPLEITKQMGQRIRERLLADAGGQFDRVAIAGLTNAYVSYASTPEEYDTCEYEGSFTLFGRQQGAFYRNAGTSLVQGLLGAPEQPGAPEPLPVGLASGEPPVPRVTPDAGTAVQQPGATVARHGRAVFRFNGGDAVIDAPRDRALVTVERKTLGGEFVPFTTDDGELDITELDRGSDVWTETFQTGTCDPIGSYRFRVTGKANKGEGEVDYTLTSDPFEVGKLTGLTGGPVTIDGTSARVTAEYPNPGPQALLSLPRRVRTGTVTLAVTPSGGGPSTDVIATPDTLGLQFRATVATGSTATVKSIQDGCGNTD